MKEIKELSINVIIITILIVTILVLVTLFFTGGMSKISDKITVLFCNEENTNCVCEEQAFCEECEKRPINECYGWDMYNTHNFTKSNWEYCNKLLNRCTKYRYKTEEEKYCENNPNDNERCECKEWNEYCNEEQIGIEYVGNISINCNKTIYHQSRDGKSLTPKMCILEKTQYSEEGGYICNSPICIFYESEYTETVITNEKYVENKEFWNPLIKNNCNKECIKSIPREGK